MTISEAGKLRIPAPVPASVHVQEINIMAQAEDTSGPVGAPENEDEDAPRRPMHVKRGQPGSEVEGKPKFKEPNPDEVRPEAAARARAKKR